MAFNLDTVAKIGIASLRLASPILEWKQAQANAAAAQEYEYAKAAAQQAYIMQVNREANRNAIESFKALGVRTQQEQRRSAQQIQESNLEARRNAATAIAFGAATGQEGGSIESMIYDFMRQDAINSFVSSENIRDLGFQLEQEEKSVAAQAYSRAASIQPYIPAQIAQPSKISLLGSILSGVSSGLKVFTEK